MLDSLNKERKSRVTGLGRVEREIGMIFKVAEFKKKKSRETSVYCGQKRKPFDGILNLEIFSTCATKYSWGRNSPCKKQTYQK